MTMTEVYFLARKSAGQGNFGYLPYGFSDINNLIINTLNSNESTYFIFDFSPFS
jgi:hypothetical protein